MAARRRGQKLFLASVEKCEEETERPSRPPVQEIGVAIDADLLNGSGLSRNRGGIRFGKGKLLCQVRNPNSR